MSNDYVEYVLHLYEWSQLVVRVQNTLDEMKRWLKSPAPHTGLPEIVDGVIRMKREEVMEHVYFIDLFLKEGEGNQEEGKRLTEELQSTWMDLKLYSKVGER